MIDALGNPQSVLLVGGTSEIGLAIVRRLAQGGRLNRVVLVGRSQTALEAQRDSLEGLLAAPAIVETLVADLTDLDSVDHAIAAVFTTAIDVAVIAAGVLPNQALAERDATYASEVNFINFIGPVHAGTRITEQFRQQGRGVLVVMSTVAAERPRKDNFVYGAAKAGLDAWANGMADALVGSGIRILVVRPGMVRTRMSAGLPEAPLTTDADVVAEAVARHLVNGPTTIWVPAQLQVLMSGLRHLPRPVFRKVADSRGDTTKPKKKS